jgi:glycine C-acetyltransferase
MNFFDHLQGELDKLKDAKTLKVERILDSPQDAHVNVDGKDVLMLTSNNYLGFANHPRIREAQKKAIDRWGAGLGSVRFICGTLRLHHELEETISAFFETEATILYMSCWNANEGLFAAVLEEADGLYSDELNHASIIDGVRLCKAKRFKVPHSDCDAYEKMLSEDATSRYKMMVSDGVFSMEGELADLPALLSTSEKYGAVLAVDDSHATGVLGKTGRGTAEEEGIHGDIPITTGTLGKAMGSAAGGFVTGPKALVDLLRQRSRTSLFSNSLPPAVVGGSLEAFRMLMQDSSPVEKLRENALYFRREIKDAGFTIPEGPHPIVPVIVGDTAKALAMSAALFDEGVYVSGFGFPVVPHGHARLRCQISAGHSKKDLDFAVECFRKVGKKFGAVS